MRHGRRETSGTLSSTAPDGGLFTTISYETSFQNCLKMWICTLEFIYGSCMIVFHHIFFLHFGILEQRASGAIDRTGWANNMACSFSRFISLIIYLWRNVITTAYATEVSDV